MNRDEMKGRTDEVKGKVKQGVGDVTGDEEMKNEGRVNEAKGSVQEGYGTAKRKTGDAVEEIGEKLKD